MWLTWNIAAALGDKMEGPSIFLAIEQLSPLIGQKIVSVDGNTKIAKERLISKTILSMFSFGKQLFFQFEFFALRVHFLLYGSFEATIRRKKVTGDYPKKNRVPRLALKFKIGHVEMYSCSVRFIEHTNIKSLCDFSVDIMSSEWSNKKALASLKNSADYEIADVLLDQEIFAGVGNIIKNETLLRAGVLPDRKVGELSIKTLQRIIDIARVYVFQFYEWRKNFELKKHYLIYRQQYCKKCGGEVKRKRTGLKNRISFICFNCQK